MSTETTLSAPQENKMTLFGKARQALQEVGIDLAAIVETYEFFQKQRKDDPELRIPTYRAKIPSGGGRAFDIITGDENFDTSVPCFRGVIASYHNCNALFAEGENMNEPPICQSQDGCEGRDSETGEMILCAECHHNQWGTSRKGGKGKACKNMRRLYILVEGSDIPIVMTLPPTSIAGWEKYKSAVLAVQRRIPQDVVTEFSLSSNTNAQGKKYSVVQFKVVGLIGNETRMTVKALTSGEVYDKTIAREDYDTVTQEDDGQGE